MSARKPVVIIAVVHEIKTRGIGLAATSILLKQFGANVVAISRTISQELLGLASDNLLTIQCDVSDEAGLMNAIKRGHDTFKHIDGLILNAGTLDPLCRIGDGTPLSSWRSHFEGNFFYLVSAVQAALPALCSSEFGGRVVFVSSGAAVKGTAGWGPYNASKAAMNSLCRTLAEEQPDVISVALRPGTVDTAMQQVIRELGSKHMTQSDHQKFTRLHMDGVLLKPELPGQVIAALSLRAPKALSGQFVSWDDDSCKELRSDR
ncbi:NAD(P)-binding protein [Marasmius fiardii PR-910]|nr:NAD(P)-binding protein [Marasmius fiardii PR-910]